MIARDWVEYFSESTPDAARWFAHWQYHTPFYDLLLRVLPRESRLLDIGCGLGETALLLAAFGFQVVGIDREESLVQRAADSAQRLGVNVSFQRGDLMNLSEHRGRYDAVLSLGLMEHFDPPQAASLVAEQARCGKRVIVNIPSVWASVALPFVDERPYTLRDLKRLGETAGLVTESSTGYGDVRGGATHEAIRQLCPRVVYRAVQRRGYASSLTAVFRRRI